MSVTLNWINQLGDICDGQYKIVSISDNNVPILHGIGTLTTSKGLKYEGYFINGIKHGPVLITNMNNGKTIHVNFDKGFIRDDVNIEK